MIGGLFVANAHIRDAGVTAHAEFRNANRLRGLTIKQQKFADEHGTPAQCMAGGKLTDYE